MLSKRNSKDVKCGTYKSWKSGSFQQWKDDEGYIYIRVMSKDYEYFPVTVYGDGSWNDKLGVQKEIWSIHKHSRK